MDNIIGASVIYGLAAYGAYTIAKKVMGWRSDANEYRHQTSATAH